MVLALIVKHRQPVAQVQSQALHVARVDGVLKSERRFDGCGLL